MKKRKPNSVSRYLRRAAKFKMKHPNLGCCRCLLDITGSVFDYMPASGLFAYLFRPGSNPTYWWEVPGYNEDPDFEARMLALLLAELIAMEGGL